MISDETLSVASETEQLREQLLRAQRLSSVGTLASSVAHEFNNILTTLINYAKLGMKPGATEASRLQSLEKILNVTQREATDLVALVEEVLLLTEKDLSKHQIRLEKKYQGRPHAPVVRGQIE